ncbi:hypothetical protein NDU88_003869 [Pleurodeles waltl]|uniref:Uncharacterized protein n=1 Tax=Pleurodeles waltl TaxID=8319 RepID=A0AAV7T630_PLEWA|nr:hypothetical protein NDU88_003869 [Pleurodeles waltl]
MRQPLTGHLIAHGLTVQGGPVTFGVDAHAAYRTELFYSWVVFPAVDGGTNTFYEYTIANVPGQYRAYAYLEIPLSYQEHHNWLDGTLPHTVAQVRLGPLSNDGPTWPLLATYTPYPAVANLAVADVRRLYIDLATTYRRLVQFVMQALNTNAARAAPAHPQAVVPGINPATVHSVMGKDRELPRIIAETYSSIGRDSLGARPQKPQLQGKNSKDNAKQQQPEGTKKRWEKKQQTPKKDGGQSPQPETPKNRYNLRNRDNLKTPDRYQYTDTCQSGSFQDSSDKRSERGGRSERRTEYVKRRQESQRSTEVSVKQEEKPLLQKQQFKKKKVAAVSVRHAAQEESSLDEQDMGVSTVRQCGRGHNSSPESSRASGGESN